MTTLAFALFLVLIALLGAPLFAVIGAVALVGFHALGVSLAAVPMEIYRLADTPVLLALPLFTFAGYVLAESNTSQRIVRLTRCFLGWLPGGLAVVAVVACAFFTAFTGATGVTIVALGALLYPALVSDGYKDSFSLGLVTTSGSLGILLPPSLPLIIYGIVVQQMDTGYPVTISGLFLAGVFPMLIMTMLLCLWGLWTNRKGGLGVTRFSSKEALAALRDAAWEIPLPFLVLGGIYGGVFAVSEAAAVTALYVLVVEVFIYREVPLKKLGAIMRESMVMVGGILLILGVALASSTFLIDAQVPARLFDIIQAHVHGKIVFLLLLNILLLFLGCILDIFSALVIMVPLIVPVAASYGIHPVHLGIIFCANMQIGYLTPPVGMSLFIASYRFRKPIPEIYKAAIPFMLVLLAALVLITYWPALSMFLVR